MSLSLITRDLADVGGPSAPPGTILGGRTNLSKLNIACQVLSYVIVGGIVLARVYTKIFLRPGFGLEDYTCLVAWILALALSGLALACIPVYGGVHQVDVPLSGVRSFLQLQFFGELTYYLATFLTKTSILCLIARVFKPHRRAVFLSRCLIGVTALYCLPVFFVTIFRCRPIHEAWDPNVGGNCIASEYGILFADCIVSLLTFVGIFFLPIPLVWKLQTSLRRKIRIMVVFAGGLGACAAIIARIVVVLTLDSKDSTFTIQIVMLLAIIEVNIGIICSCLPVLPAFYKHVINSAKSVIPKSSTYHELDVVGKSGTGVERMRPGDAEEGKGDIATALHLQYLGPSNPAGGPSSFVSGGAKEHDSSERLWGGDGILKTVRLERVEMSAPEPDTSVWRPESAVLPSEHPKKMQGLKRKHYE